MPSSLIIVALVVTWLVVLVPLVARKRQESARGVDEEGVDEEYAMADADEHDEFVERPFRSGRGGFDPKTAAVVAQAKYAFRRRVVAFLLFASLVTGVVAGVMYPVVWWGHGGVALVLVGYLVYLRRQVRIEEEIRARRQARLVQPRRRHAAPRPRVEHAEPAVEEPAPAIAPRPRFQHEVRPGTIPVDADDEDPMFVELDGPETLPYRRAVGE